ncbi:hypothetical protein GWK47_051594 [Chionoecetes opilio]|uniref:Uncharacterized protein n=1 Tax=Chionoecetes opilio TaxID=41210 RepID=A0A8J4YCN5_CHIOP|nr:hypothetical protein GWK47_051594 [Chionoecetes opilio]
MASARHRTITVSRSSSPGQKSRTAKRFPCLSPFKPEVPFFPHWDGKILPTTDGILEGGWALLVSGGVQEILGVFSCFCRRDRTNVAGKSLETGAESSLGGNIIGVAFDTSGPKTGRFKGVLGLKVLENPRGGWQPPPPIPENCFKGKDVFDFMGAIIWAPTSPFQRLQNRLGLSLTSRQARPDRSVIHKKPRLRCSVLERLLDCGKHPAKTTKSHPLTWPTSGEESYILPCSWGLPPSQMDGPKGPSTP